MTKLWMEISRALTGAPSIGSISNRIMKLCDDIPELSQTMSATVFRIMMLVKSRTYRVIQQGSWEVTHDPTCMPIRIMDNNKPPRVVE